MTRYWVSWYSGNYADEGCTKPPFTFWVSGTSFRENDGLTQEELEIANAIEDEEEYEEYVSAHYRDDCTICACIDAESEDDIWPVVAKHFPDYRQRFCEERDADYKPGDRFPLNPDVDNGQFLTSLTTKE